jgi:alpha-glucosidase
MEVFRDGVNADKYAQDYKYLKTNVKSGDQMKLVLAQGGGWVARIIPKQ